RVTSTRCQAEGMGTVPAAPVLSPTAGNPSLAYALALLFFMLGLMSKTMVVTVPFVMLLLDYWPLKRMSVASGSAPPFVISALSRLVLEKLPFFALAAVVSVITYHAQKTGGMMIAMAGLPLSARASNALVSYCRYLGKLFWPVDLCVLYQHPGHWPVATVV